MIREKKKWSLYPHQLSGVAFDKDRQASFFAWGMGSGKTLAAITAAMEQRAVIVVAPISVGPAWARHFAEHDPDRVVCNAFSGAAAQRAKRLAETAADAARGRRIAVIINYDSIWRPNAARAIEALPIDRIILDESHRAKAPGGKASRYLYGLAKKFPTAKRLCLTGTPCPHSPLDYYAQMRFLDATALGTSFAAFRARYSIPHPRFPGAVLEYRNQQELAERVAPYQHTVDTDAVLELPDAIHTRIDVPLSPAEAQFVRQMVAALVAEAAGAEVVATNVLTQLLRCQQACSGHTVVGERDERETIVLNGCGEQTSKGAALADWLEDVPGAEPVVVFCKFREDLRQTAIAAHKAGRKCLELSGSCNDLDLWQKSTGSEVLAVQIQSGGVGIDLTRAGYCAFMSLGYSLGDYEQALARLRRPGQTQTCRYWHLVGTLDNAHTVDELVYHALQERRDIVNQVLDLVRDLDTLRREGTGYHANRRADDGLGTAIGNRRGRKGAR
jgi:SNF2 family DNA or RNA helicase